MNKWVAGALLLGFVFLALISVLFGDRIRALDISQLRMEKTAEVPTQGSQLPTTSDSQASPKTTVVAQDLEVPWALAFLPDKSILFTERSGRVRFIDAGGKLQQQPIETISEVREISEGGLLGIAVHPEFSTNNYVYVYYTYSSDNDNTLNRVVRYTFTNNALAKRTVIVDAIPGAANHDGGRIKFGPDGYLYIATGDSQEPSLSQSRTSLAGKILRVTDEGKAAPGNPFGSAQDKSALIYSYGHRNPQGLAWDKSGQLWSTEHGRSGLPSGLDELNRITAGKNYGWPTIQGDETKDGMVTPILNSESTTWAPSGAAFYNSSRGEAGGSIFFAGLRGQGLYEAVLNGDSATLKKHFDGELGRIREVVLGPDNMLYITTSNRDGRGIPKANDDKILRVNPAKL